MAADKSFTIRKEDPRTESARTLIGELDAYLDPLYPKESQHGYSIEELVAQRVEFFVLYGDEAPVACGGVQFFGDLERADEGYGEIKRMYVRPEFRGRGYAKKMLQHLEGLAASKGFSKVRLETGISQPEAIGLYERNGYYKIPPFGDYWEDPLSFFYENNLGG